MLTRNMLEYSSMPIERLNPEIVAQEIKIAKDNAKNLLKHIQQGKKKPLGKTEIEVLPDYLQTTIESGLCGHVSVKEPVERVVLKVESDTFLRIITRENIEYVFVFPFEDISLYDNVKVWYITLSKLRVQTTTNLSSDFMHDVIRPSEMAQYAQIKSEIGNRDTTFEELHDLNDVKGIFVNYDNGEFRFHSIRVERVKVLPRNERNKFKDSFVAFKIGK